MCQGTIWAERSNHSRDRLSATELPWVIAPIRNPAIHDLFPELHMRKCGFLFDNKDNTRWRFWLGTKFQLFPRRHACAAEKTTTLAFWLWRPVGLESSWLSRVHTKSVGEIFRWNKKGGNEVKSSPKWSKNFVTTWRTISREMLILSTWQNNPHSGSSAKQIFYNKTVAEEIHWQT